VLLQVRGGTRVASGDLRRTADSRSKSEVVGGGQRASSAAALPSGERSPSTRRVYIRQDKTRGGGGALASACWLDCGRCTPEVPSRSHIATQAGTAPLLQHLPSGVDGQACWHVKWCRMVPGVMAEERRSCVVWPFGSLISRGSAGARIARAGRRPLHMQHPPLRK
jgi:hypothetical protein